MGYYLPSARAITRSIAVHIYWAILIQLYVYWDTIYFGALPTCNLLQGHYLLGHYVYSRHYRTVIRAPALRASAALKPGRVPRSSGYVTPLGGFWRKASYGTLFHQTLRHCAVRHSDLRHVSCPVKRDRLELHRRQLYRRQLQLHRRQLRLAASSIAASSIALPIPSPPASSPPAPSGGLWPITSSSQLPVER